MAKAILKKDAQGRRLGYFPEDSRDPQTRLLSTSKVIDMKNPFGKVVGDVALPWANKLRNISIIKNEVKTEIKDDFFSEMIGQDLNNHSTDHDSIIKTIPSVIDYFQQANITTQRNGNYAEEVLEAILEKRDRKDFDEDGNILISSEEAIKFGNGFFKELTKILGTEDIDKINEYRVGTQIALWDKKNRTMGKLDDLYDVPDRGLILIDYKSGSEVKGDKKKKAVEQLVGSYLPKVEQEYGKRPSEVYIISSFEKIATFREEKTLVYGSKIIDVLKRIDVDHVIKVFDESAKFYWKLVEWGYKKI